ncbi:MAG: hypothetical protein H6713_34230 [Myxococcales bacterium]|nr:hypothetical protein [Myxococcales bacterium]
MKMSSARLKTLARRLGARVDDRPARALLIRRIRVALSLAYPALHGPRVHLADFQRALDFLEELARGGAEAREEALSQLASLVNCDRPAARARALGVLLRVSPPRLVDGLAALMGRPDPSARHDALRFAVDHLGRAAEPLVRRGLADESVDVQRVAVWAASGWLLEVNERELARMVGRTDYGINVMGRALHRFGTELDALIEGAFHRRAELRYGARYVLSNVAVVIKRARAVPPTLWLYPFHDAQNIALALWRRQPIGWAIPAWMRERKSKDDRKLLRRLQEISLRYHRGLLVGALRGRPSRSRLLARQRRRLLGALRARARARR